MSVFSLPLSLFPPHFSSNLFTSSIAFLRDQWSSFSVSWVSVDTFKKNSLHIPKILAILHIPARGILLKHPQLTQIPSSPSWAWPFLPSIYNHLFLLAHKNPHLCDMFHGFCPCKLSRKFSVQHLFPFCLCGSDSYFILQALVQAHLSPLVTETPALCPSSETSVWTLWPALFTHASHPLTETYYVAFLRMYMTVKYASSTILWQVQKGAEKAKKLKVATTTSYFLHM